MEYLIRLVQVHESFRLAELEALAMLADVEIEIVSYLEDSPYCIVRFPRCTTAKDATAAARRFISRSILARGIYELWGSSPTGDYTELHSSVKANTPHLWPLYRDCSFAFSTITFNETLSVSQQRARINSFSYLGFEGRVELKKPDEQFVIFEEHDYSPTKLVTHPSTDRTPKRLYFGRWIGDTSRHLVDVHDLKKRPYISTTSMDAELALITANLALAGPGKLFYDPFVGTGGFLVSAAQFGAVVMGSDIDGRSFRGKDNKRAKGVPASAKGLDVGVGTNMIKYGIRDQLLDCFISDLTNTPLRIAALGRNSHPTDEDSDNEEHGWLDGIISDPPYGVREGLKVLGLRQKKLEGLDGSNDQLPTPRPPPHFIDGVPAHTLPGYVPPKRPYSFNAMLDDILAFAARTLVEDGRLSFWMPVYRVVEDEFMDEHGEPGHTDESDSITEIPRHAQLELVSICVQEFNKWSRRLLTYRRRRKDELKSFSQPQLGLSGKKPVDADASIMKGTTADDLNDFRRRYFQPNRSKGIKSKNSEPRQL